MVDFMGHSPTSLWPHGLTHREGRLLLMDAKQIARTYSLMTCLKSLTLCSSYPGTEFVRYLSDSICSAISESEKKRADVEPWECPH